MTDYVTEAFVLKKETWNEFDARVMLYTPMFGKMWAKVKSSKKILSRLNGHLEPLNKVMVRVVEKNGYHIVDALRFGRVSPLILNALPLLDALTHEDVPDARMWGIIRSIPYDRDLLYPSLLARKMLEVGGFAPLCAECAICKAKPPHYFMMHTTLFLCDSCIPYSQMMYDEVVSI